jgi:hypothetical protein
MPSVVKKNPFQSQLDDARLIFLANSAIRFVMFRTRTAGVGDRFSALATHPDIATRLPGTGVTGGAL